MKNQKKPSICNCLNLRRASAAITKLYDEKLAPSGLTVSQFSILKHIQTLGPISVSHLAVAMRLDRTTLVRNLKPLEATFFVCDVAKKGTRNRQLQLTEKGIERLVEADSYWTEAQMTIEQKIGRENIKTLTSLLSMIEEL